MDVREYEIDFLCWPGYFTSEQSEWVRYPVQHKLTIELPGLRWQREGHDVYRS